MQKVYIVFCDTPSLKRWSELITVKATEDSASKYCKDANRDVREGKDKFSNHDSDYYYETMNVVD